MPRRPSIAALRHQPQAPNAASLPFIGFGLPTIDAHLPDGGLACAALHEITGGGTESEHAAAASLFVAGVCARLALERRLLWVLERCDLFAPALAAVGLHPDRVIYAEIGRPKQVLQAMEDALHHHGLAAVVGEIAGSLSLTASRRLLLACKTTGTTAFLLRHSHRHDDPVMAMPSAAATRWRITALPSGPVRSQLPEMRGLPRARWLLQLLRCRDGEPGTWIVEACDAQGRLGVPAEFREPVAAAPNRAACNEYSDCDCTA